MSGFRRISRTSTTALLLFFALGWRPEVFCALGATPPTTATKMAARIDQLLEARWEEEGAKPAAVCDDAAFLRRVSLDLTGVIPSVAAARAFLADKAPNKREELVDRLLRSPRHASHLATVWRARMLNEQLGPQQLQTAVGLERWLRQQFALNLRYDNLVADLVASTGSQGPGPAIYFRSLEFKPEKLASSTARIFMGLQIQCAECHNHPFDHWTQQDFWGYAAFFAQLRGQDQTRPPFQPELALQDTNRGEVTLPEQDEPAPPRFPGGDLADSTLGGTRRQQLAIWLASRDNPYLARAAVNWAWAHLFGRGLVDPVDDLGDHNPPSHPQLMRELCDYFEHQQFDLRDLLETLCRTRAYQLSSRAPGQDDGVALTDDLFAKMAVKALTAEQHYDSLSLCLSQNETQPAMTPPGQGGNVDQRRLQFIIQMQTPARSALEYESGPRQALQLMNGPLANAATSIEQSALLGGLEAPFFTDAQRLETLYLATLSRFPRENERQRLMPLLKEAATPEQRQLLLSDILWAILNTAEYGLND